MSKRKPHNKNKRIKRLMNTYINKVGVLYISGLFHGKCFAVKLNGGKKFPVMSEVAVQMEEGFFKWNVYCAVLCRDNDGNNYLKGSVVDAPIKCQQREIAVQIHEAHMAVYRNANPDHIITVAWIGVPSNRELSEEEAYKIFEDNRGFEFLSQGEAKLQDVA